MTAAAGATVIQIVPRRVREPDGVGDYATNLANALLEQSGIRTIFLAGTSMTAEQDRADGWCTTPLAERSGIALACALATLNAKARPSAILLHFSGYGYAKRGAPFWVLRGIARWKRRFAGSVRLIGIFHELYAVSYKPWQSSFFLGPLQRTISAKLLHYCDAAITTNSAYATTLAKWASGRALPLVTLPAFSNIGEPSEVLPPADRPARLMVFGGQGLKNEVYGPSRSAVARIVAAHNISQIVDIGRTAGPIPTSIDNVPVVARGALPSEDISSEMLNCRFGITIYSARELAKSTIFAAMAAHGVLPVCLSDRTAPADGLHAGVHYLPANTGALTDAEYRAVQLASQRWYATHRLSAQAQALTAMVDRFGI